MKIVHLGKYYPPDTGGIESVSASLARGAAAHGHEVDVVSFGRKSSSVLDAGARVLRHWVATTVASQPLSPGYVIDAIRRGRRADVVHVHVPNMLAAWAAMRMGRRPAMVVHWHSDVIDKGLLGRLLGPLEVALLQRADAIICTSPPYAQASPILHPFAAKIRVVPIGVPEADAGKVDEAVVPQELRAWIGSRKLVLCIGRPVPYKGYESLIDAASSLREDAAIMVVGEGPLTGQLQARITHGRLAHRIRLTGRLDDAALTWLRRRADVFCMPSVERSEAFGVVLIEAMAVGRALLATDIPGSGVPWVNLHGVSGLNVPPNDPLELAAAIDRLLTDDALRLRLAQGARQRYEQMFTEAESVRGTLEVYAGLPTRAAA